MNTDMKH